jgi:hypothetical protein
MTEARLMDALDRFMTSLTLRDARDALREEPGLLGNEILEFLEETVRRLRQQNDDEFVVKAEHWLGLLRVFRQYGVEEGYLELLTDSLTRADAEQTRRLLADYPELSSDATRQYFERRERESHLAADQNAATKYLMAAVVSANSIAEQTLDVDLTFAGEFLANYVSQDDEALRHRYLTAHPELLEMPTLMYAEASFQPSMDQAWADVDVVALRNLFLRRAMLRRAAQVGVQQTIREYEEGAEWPDLLTT